MRNATDDLDAKIERPDGVLPRCRRPVQPVLRECHQLQVDVVRDLFFDFEQGLDRQQPVVADIDMGTDGKQAHRSGPVAIGKRPFLHRFMGQKRLEFPPQADPLEQRSRGIDPRQSVGQGRIHVKMRVDEGRRNQIARDIDNLASPGVDTG
jgi:hypothetical protein